MEDKVNQMEEELRQFDFVQFAMCDVHGIPRGRLVPRHMLSQACRHGVSIYSRSQYVGCYSGLPTFIEGFRNFPNGTMRPLAGTVHPLEWSSAPKRRIGLVLCQMELKERELFQECPRLVAQRQVDRLAKKGFQIKSAFECEFHIVKKDSLELLGDCRPAFYANLNAIDRRVDFFTGMLTALLDSGVHVEYFAPESSDGQYEASMQPQWGVGSADDAFLFRYGVRSFCFRHDLLATFMPIPFAECHPAGLHFNHSLWSQDGGNLFHDPQDPLKLSKTARHWIAGLLEHAPALMAFGSPTLNCYRRMGVHNAPGDIFWNIDDRKSAVRAKTTGGNVFLENRMPSSACNPFFTLAATIAAGLDGVERQLTCPEPGHPPSGQPVRRLPSSLAEALDALEKDEVMTQALGGGTVDYFLTIKRGLELKHCQDVKTDPTDPSTEREYYMDAM